jgi:hypothetical protein
MCYSVTLYQKVKIKLSKSCQKVVKKLSKSCQKVVKKLSKNCHKVAKKLLKSCQKIVKKLPKLPKLSRIGCEWKIVDHVLFLNKVWGGVGGWVGGQKVVPRPSATTL